MGMNNGLFCPTLRRRGGEGCNPPMNLTISSMVPFLISRPVNKWLLRDRCVKPTCIGGGSGHIKNKKKGKRESELINNLVTLGKPGRGAAYSVVTSWRMSATSLLK